MTATEVLSHRFENDGKNVNPLNSLQKETRDTVRKKVETDVYNFQTVACPICGNSTEFDALSKKDRYGLFHPVNACRVCGLVQTNPRMTEESYAEFYNSEYRLLYDGRREYAGDRFRVQKENAERIYEYINETTAVKLDSANVLDVGCGPGGMPAYFQDQGSRVSGCDLDTAAISYGKEQGVPLQVGTVDELDLDWKPDVVILSHIVEHFLSPVEDLRRIRELLHEDSVVYIGLPGVKWLSRFRTYYGADFLKQLQNAHTYYFTETSLNNMMRKAGFEAIDIDEHIQSIFKPSESGEDADFESDYPDVVAHLERLEKWNRWGITPIPTSPYEAYTHPMTISLLKRSGIYPLARRAYHKLH